MSDPYVEWIEKEAASARAKERRDRIDRHTPPDTVPLVTYEVTCPVGETMVEFETINDAVNYIRSLLIAGVPGEFATRVAE